MAESSSDASNIAFAANSVAFDKDNSDWKPSLITVWHVNYQIRW